jgi:RNA polymerase sigma-70 factor, ECF subfamily
MRSGTWYGRSTRSRDTQPSAPGSIVSCAMHYGKIRGRRRTFVDISLDEVLRAFDESGGHAGPVRDWSSSVDDRAVQNELRAVLSSAISELPAHYRAVIILRDVEMLSMAEVADALRITVPIGKTRAHRARLLLRKRLSMFMTSVGAAGDWPARWEYQRRSMR